MEKVTFHSNIPKLLHNYMIQLNENVLRLSNKSEENNGEEKKTIDIKFTEQMADPENYGNAIDFLWSDVQGEVEEDIT